MDQLENLLNSLIKMGWKPWGKLEANECTVKYQKQVCVWNKHYRMLRKGNLRELVSQESGLWQFCEENGLLHEYYNWRSSTHPYKCYWTITYEYGLIESALVPEEELAQFLIDNIKTE